MGGASGPDTPTSNAANFTKSYSFLDPDELEETTVCRFLLRRLYEAGLEDIFGVPGDFVLGLFNEILKSDIRYVGTCNELNAAYAADAYARVKGIGAVTTTYTVGELSALNGVAGSFAENVPVVKLTGCPPTIHYSRRTLLHHTLGDYHIPKDIYSKVCVAHTLLNNPRTAVTEIERVLSACLLHMRPVYIGICSDMILAKISAPKAPFQRPPLPVSDPNALEEAVLETLRRLTFARHPILIPGVEIRRHGLQKDFVELIDRCGIPFATMMLGKTVIDEDHPQNLGLYCGDRSREYVRNYVENSDCLIIFGEMLTDFNTGGFTAVLDNRSTIIVNRDRVAVSFHHYHEVYIHDFIRSLTSRVHKRNFDEMELKTAVTSCVHRRGMSFHPVSEKKLTMHRMFDRIAKFIPENAIVIAETGASLFSAAEVLMPKGTHFIGQTFYGSIGYTVGACLGACIAAPDTRVILFVGDGSFQVTCQELSTMLRYGCKPTIFLVNNDGYTIERVIVDHPYNDIQMWKYKELPAAFGGDANSVKCSTEGELESALDGCEKSGKLNFLEVILGRFDCNDALRRAGATMAKTNRLLEDGPEPQHTAKKQKATD